MLFCLRSLFSWFSLLYWFSGAGCGAFGLPWIPPRRAMTVATRLATEKPNRPEYDVDLAES